MKRIKTEELPVKTQPTQSSETLTTAQPDDGKNIVEEHNTVYHIDEVKMQHENDDEEEDPEEDLEEYEEMEEDESQQNPSSENNEGKIDINAEPGNEKDEPDESLKGESDMNATETKATSDSNTSEKREAKVDVNKKEIPAAKEAVVDKELLQVFFLLSSCMMYVAFHQCFDVTLFFLLI